MSLAIFYDSDIVRWVNTLGYFGIAAIVFAETGLFFCFFLPGDSLLFTAGMLAAAHVLNIYLLIPILIAAAFFGYWLGYFIGFYFGKRLARGGDTWYYKKKYARNAHRFMKKYGKLALLFGRLVGVVRSFLPLIAGMAHMRRDIYTWYNFLGAIIWCLTVPLLGFFLGKLIPNVTDYLLFFVVAIVILSLFPGLWERRKRKRALHKH